MSEIVMIENYDFAFFMEFLRVGKLSSKLSSFLKI